MLSNQFIAAIILNGLSLFSASRVQFSFGLLCMALFVLKNEYLFLKMLRFDLKA